MGCMHSKTKGVLGFRDFGCRILRRSLFRHQIIMDGSLGSLPICQQSNTVNTHIWQRGWSLGFRVIIRWNPTQS